MGLLPMAREHHRQDADATSEDRATRIGQATVREFYTFRRQQTPLAPQFGSACFSDESSRREVRGDDAVARDFRREGVGAQGLSDGAG